jgi:hypothetical protein
MACLLAAGWRLTTSCPTLLLVIAYDTMSGMPVCCCCFCAVGCCAVAGFVYVCMELFQKSDFF